MVKNNLNPSFNDEFSFVVGIHIRYPLITTNNHWEYITSAYFQISHNDVMKKSIVFQVWDHDLGKDDPQGEVCIVQLWQSIYYGWSSLIIILIEN